MNEEIDEEFTVVSEALEFAFDGEYDLAREHLDLHLRRNAFLNAGLVLSALARIALDLADIEDRKVREEYRKKPVNE